MSNSTSNAEIIEYSCPASHFRKSNSLIRSRYMASLFENQLLSISLAFVRNSSDGRLKATLNKKQVRDMLGKNYGNYYKTLKTSAMRLMNSIIMAEDPETRKFKASHLITDVEINDGSLTIIFNETFRNQILDLKGNYTLLSLTCLTNFDRVGTFRLYETLRSSAYYSKDSNIKKTGHFKVEYGLSELRCMLNCVDLDHKEIQALFNGTSTPDYDKVVEVAQALHDEDIKKGVPKKDLYPEPKYGRWNNLKLKVIEPSVEEINEKTELCVEFKEIFEGKSHKVTGVEFFITDTNFIKKDYELKEEIKPEQPHINMDLLSMLDEGLQDSFSIKDLKSFLNAAENDIDKINEAYKVYEAAKNVSNPAGFVIEAIRQGYRKPEPKKQKKKNSFEFSNQRNYDFDELEEMLLNK